MGSATVSASTGAVNGGLCGCCCCLNGGNCCFSPNSKLIIAGNQWMTANYGWSDQSAMCAGTRTNFLTQIWTVLSDPIYLTCGQFCVKTQLVSTSDYNDFNNYTKYQIAFISPGINCWGAGYMSFDTEEEMDAYVCNTADAHYGELDPNNCTGVANLGGTPTVQNCKKFELNTEFCTGTSSFVYQFGFTIENNNCCVEEDGSCKKGDSTDDGSCTTDSDTAPDPFP